MVFHVRTVVTPGEQGVWWAWGGLLRKLVCCISRSGCWYMDVLTLWKSTELYPYHLYRFLYMCYTAIISLFKDAIDTRESACNGIHEICSLEAMPVITRPNILGDSSVPRVRLTETPHSPSLTILPTLSSLFPKSVSSWWCTPQHRLLPSSPSTLLSVIQKPLLITFCI